ncbi:hypothetical protein [Candidatus Aalborgicola defluviihabitans]|nr:hypothetical protein [Burkholderiales bacterium]
MNAHLKFALITAATVLAVQSLAAWGVAASRAAEKQAPGGHGRTAPRPH